MTIVISIIIAVFVRIFEGKRETNLKRNRIIRRISATPRIGKKAGEPGPGDELDLGSCLSSLQTMFNIISFYEFTSPHPPCRGVFPSLQIRQIGLPLNISIT